LSHGFDDLPRKSFNDLLAEGIPHKGEVAMLAKAEWDGPLFGGPSCTDPELRRKPMRCGYARAQ
jgi:hypothetical protein